MKKKLLALLFCSGVLLSGGTEQCLAAPGVTIVPASDNVYVIQGTDFSGVSGMDVSFRYDPAALGAPKVALASLTGGALMAANVSTPGTIRFALVKTTEINGSGAVATVAFNRLKKSTNADILSLSASVLTSTGRTVQATSAIANSRTTADEQRPASGDSGASEQERDPGESGRNLHSDNTPGTMDGSAISRNPALLVQELVQPGITTSPGQEQPATDLGKPDGSSELVTTAKAEKQVLRPRDPEKERVMAYQSILEKFREYTGEKTPRALMALFTSGTPSQDPAFVLTDGKATVKIIMELDSQGENNNFLIEGATLITLTNKEKNFWIAELLPDSSSLQSAVAIPRNGYLNIMPLAVAPPLGFNIGRSSGKLSEADFRLFLKEQGTAKAPRFDLNGDGKRDYIDEYIFTANYIAQQHRKDPQKKAR